MPQTKSTRRKASGAKKTVRRKRILWTATDLKFLRQNAGKRSVSALARALKRSAAAVRFKGSAEGISLRMK